MFALRNEKFRLFIGKALYHDFGVFNSAILKPRKSIRGAHRAISSRIGSPSLR